MKFRNLSLIIALLFLHTSLTFSQSRLDSIRTKSVSSPTADTIFRGNDYLYEGNNLKKLTNFTFVNGTKNVNTYSESGLSIGKYSNCTGFYLGTGVLLRYRCEFDSTVNNTLAKCSKTFEKVNENLKLTEFSMNFKILGPSGEIKSDSTIYLKPETLQLDNITVSCFKYDNKLNVVELIRKTIEGTSTFYGDKTEYDIKYDAQGRKKSEVIKWTYILQTRAIDSIAYSYVDDKIIENKYFIFSTSGITNDLSVTTRDNRGILNIKLYRKNTGTTDLYLRSNADYYYSMTSSLNVDNKKDLFTIYPNPASDHVQFNIKQKAVLQIRTISGALLIHTEINPGEKSEIHHLSSGFYFATLTFGTGQTQTFPFLKR